MPAPIVPRKSRRAERMREDRQEDLREKISNIRLVSQLFDSITQVDQIVAEMRGPSETVEMIDGEPVVTKDLGNLGESQCKVNAIAVNNKTRLALLGKILPDLKAIEVAGDLGLKLVELNMTGIFEEDEVPDQELTH